MQVSSKRSQSFSTTSTPFTKWQDFKQKGTQKFHVSALPKNLYLRPSLQSRAVVSHAEDPKNIILVIKGDKKLSLPGGYAEFGESPLNAAIRNFMEDVSFKVNENRRKKSQAMSEKYGKEIFITEGVESVRKVQPVPGMYGRVDMSSLNVKWTRPGGPFLGIFGIPEPEMGEHSVSFGYHLTVGHWLNQLIPGPGVFKVIFCDVVELIARNLAKLTSNPQTHPLFPRLKILIEEQKKRMSMQKNVANENQLCNVGLVPGHLRMINKYYLGLVQHGIISRDGGYQSDFLHPPPYQNENLLYSLYFQVMKQQVDFSQINVHHRII